MNDGRDYDLGYSDVGYFVRGRDPYHRDPDKALVPDIPAGWLVLAALLVVPAVIAATHLLLPSVR